MIIQVHREVDVRKSIQNLSWWQWKRENRFLQNVFMTSQILQISYFMTIIQVKKFFERMKISPPIFKRVFKILSRWIGGILVTIFEKWVRFKSYIDFLFQIWCVQCDHLPFTKWHLPHSPFVSQRNLKSVWIFSVYFMFIVVVWEFENDISKNIYRVKNFSTGGKKLVIQCRWILTSLYQSKWYHRIDFEI